MPSLHDRLQMTLGDAYCARVERARAAEHYKAFIDLWKNADPELQPRVKQARLRLSVLDKARGARRTCPPRPNA